MSYVQLFPGHYALMMDSQGTGLYDTSKPARDVARTLIHSHIPGFYHPEKPHSIVIARIVHVMPKTFVGEYAIDLADGRILKFISPGRRFFRDHVIACAQSPEAATALRSKLLRIGNEADWLIVEQLLASQELQALKARVDAIEGKITQRVHEAAFSQLRDSLPELFGRSGRKAA